MRGCAPEHRCRSYAKTHRYHARLRAHDSPPGTDCRGRTGDLLRSDGDALPVDGGRGAAEEAHVDPVAHVVRVRVAQHTHGEHVRRDAVRPVQQQPLPDARDPSPSRFSAIPTAAVSGRLLRRRSWGSSPTALSQNGSLGDGSGESSVMWLSASVISVMAPAHAGP